LSKKHNTETKEIVNYVCKKCDKIYGTSSGLWKHNEKCKLKIEKNEKNEIMDIQKNIAIMIESQKEFQKEITQSIIKMNSQIPTASDELKNNNIENIILSTEQINKENEKCCEISSNNEITHYVYILQEREFVQSKTPIYKIGKTKKSNLTRFNQYPKGSILLFQKRCENCDLIEMKIKRLFDEKYIKHTEIGFEYYEGDNDDMCIDIFNIIIKSKKPILTGLSKLKL
jgi:hypothetical protein